MRLTLRTLLAFLDDALDPEDAAVIRQKLADSPFATSLAQNIRQALADTTLSAPLPEDASPTGDANLVAEYLDSTLDEPRIAEFERLCLESGSNLAEVAACHQILTLALKQPAEVSEDLRARLFEVGTASVTSAETIEPFSTPVGAPIAEPGPPLAGEAPFADAPTEPKIAAPVGEVPPLGPMDSGVHDASKRIKQSQSGSSGPAIAGVSDPQAVAGVQPGSTAIA
ncbi:MAG: hypothetical protein AAF664_22135, partial [Planctomycetota bacterium]